MRVQRTDDVDDLARRSPTALAMALERAIRTHDPDLERAVLAALGELGIALVDRKTLVDSLASARAEATR
jgi:hypothetical protein